MHLFLTIFREALKSLQGAGGAYCLVTAGRNHDVRGGPLRGFCEGDNIRVIRPKENAKRPKVANVTNGEGHNATGVRLAPARAIGYGLKFTFDVEVGKAVGVLTIKACWHDIVFRNEFGFTETMFLY